MREFRMQITDLEPAVLWLVEADIRVCGVHLMSSKRQAASSRCRCRCFAPGLVHRLTTKSG